MSHASEPPAVATGNDPSSNLQAMPIQCWLLLCYLGEDGVSLRAIRIPLKDSSRVICNIQGWFQTVDPSLSPYEMQTDRELVCTIRSQPFAADDDGEQQLHALRRLALDVMSPDMEVKLNDTPPPPLSEVIGRQSQGSQPNPELIRPDINRIIPPPSDEF